MIKLNSTQLKLVESHLELFNEMEPSQVTLQKVAERANVAFGTVRYHFAGKPLDLTQASILYVVQTAYQFIEEQIGKHRTDANFHPINAYVHAMFDWVEQYRSHSSFLVYYYYLSAIQVPLEIKTTFFLERARIRIRALLHEAIGQELYPGLRATDSLVLEIHSLITGACLIGKIDILGGTKTQREVTLKAVEKLIINHG